MSPNLPGYFMHVHKVVCYTILGHFSSDKIISHLQSGVIIAELCITACTAQNDTVYCVFDRIGQMVLNALPLDAAILAFCSVLSFKYWRDGEALFDKAR